MVIAVEVKLRATRSLEFDGPQNLCPIILIEFIPRFNEEETPLLILVIMMP